MSKNVQKNVQKSSIYGVNFYRLNVSTAEKNKTGMLSMPFFLRFFNDFSEILKIGHFKNVQK